MGAVTFLSIMLGVSFAAYARFLIKEEASAEIFWVFILVVLSFLTGCFAGDANDISAADYLKSPDTYQIDTFMVNGVLDHYKVSNKN